jgi:ribonuclease P protein component
MISYEPIRENREFQRVYARGKCYVSPVLVSYVFKNRRKLLRVGITTGKKIGNAVHRNRSRRVIKESFRIIQGHVRPGYDIVFVARKKTSFVKCGEVCHAMERHLKSAGIFS